MVLRRHSAWVRSALLSGLLVVALGSMAGAMKPDDRGFVLGSSVAAVTDLTGSAATDMTVIYQRPRIIQQLIWRPRVTSGATSSGDSAHEIEFLFLDDQLFSILVRYDGDGRAGRTAHDRIAAISAVYGPPAAPRGASLAMWDSPGVTLTLSAASYRSRYHLRLVSTVLAAAARLAAAEAEHLDRLEAPRKASADGRSHQRYGHDHRCSLARPRVNA